MAPVIASPVNSFIDLFAPINPSYQRLFANTNQRKAIERLLNQFGMEQLKKIIEYTAAVQGKMYAPVITTPLELEQKVGKLMSYAQRQKNEKSKAGMLVTV